MKQSPLDNFPALDGTLLLEDGDLQKFSVDIARNLERRPRAVVRPISAADVVKTIQYANRHGLKVSIRGQGHSRYGQTLAGGGIVIDSGSLNGVSLHAPSYLDAQAGAFWGEVAGTALAEGLTLPAMGTCPNLSVGGILSAGGFSNSSHLYGAIADTVQEMDVVTGDGRLVTCSRSENAELFHMTLAGMGQCAVIVQARIQLITAPAIVVRQNLFYDDLDSFLADGSRLVMDRGKTAQSFQHLTSRATQRADGRWIFSINVGRFYGRNQNPEWTLASLAGADPGGLHFQNTTESVRASYWDYLMREAAKNAADALSREQNPRREPSLTMFVPFSDAKAFISEILSNSVELAGLADLQFNPFHVAQTRCPLFKFPDSEIAYMVWLYPRNIRLDDEGSYQAMMEINQRILARMRAVGGKSYPPYAPYFSQAEWEQHYGPETWRRLLAAKREYDPNQVLTPEMCMFDDRSGG